MTNEQLRGQLIALLSYMNEEDGTEKVPSDVSGNLENIYLRVIESEW